MTERSDRGPIDRPPRESGEPGDSYASTAHEKPDFKAYLLGGPKFDDFAVDRDRDRGRDIEAVDARLVQP